MDGWVRVLRPFNSISVISRRWKGEHERFCAMKRRLGSGRISPPAGFEPVTPWSEVGNANRSATRTLLKRNSRKNKQLRKKKIANSVLRSSCSAVPSNIHTPLRKRLLIQNIFYGCMCRQYLLYFEFCLLSRQKIAYSIRNVEIGTYYL